MPENRPHNDQASHYSGAMTLAEEWQDWCSRFDETEKGVQRLFHDRYIWKTILAMLDANPSVARGGFGEHWLGWCYTTTQLIAIRRECDNDKNSIGIGRSLGHLAGNPRIATREWFEQQIRLRARPDRESWELAQADARFDGFAAPGQPFIDAALVRRDIDDLATLIATVNAHTTKNLAHRDDITRAPSTAPIVTWGQLDAAIDAIGRLHKKYYKLRNPGKSLGGPTPVISPGWIEMFGSPWMPPGFELPNPRDFDPGDVQTATPSPHRARG